MGVILAVIVFVFGGLICLGIGNQHQFNTWNADCNRAGGIISQVSSDFIRTRYECFIDGEKVTLPGWENY